MYDRAQLRADLVRDEGVRLKPYRCTAGKLTIGIGRNIEDVGISEAEAFAMLDNDMGRCERDLDRIAPWWRQASEARQRALLNMCFQLGAGALSNFRKMLAAMQRGDWAEAASEALDSAWARQTPERAKRVTDLIRKG